VQDLRVYEALSKFDMPETERRWVNARADMLIESFAALDGIDASGAEPLVTVLDIQNVLREDEVVRVVTREELLEAAPEQYDGYFQVPWTLE